MQTACVIVTFNRLNLLKNAFHAVCAQTLPPDTIIIVDNHSTDGTSEWLGEVTQMRSDVTVLSLDKNYGGAGGFHYGIKNACKWGADWIWTLDDDTLPEHDALEKLLRCGIPDTAIAAQEVGFLASQVNWQDGSRHKMNVPGPAADWTSGHRRCPESVKIRHSSFVSILLNRNAIEQVGFPIREFFIYCDDVEFTRRITSAGFSAFYIEASKVRHLTQENAGITMDRIVANPPVMGNRAYIVRNLIAVNKREKYGLLKEGARLFYIFAKLMINRSPLGTQMALLWAGVKGLCLRYEKWIEW
ncbi:MAG: hypothetical protein B6245_22670 [Desulfobacteraceae bacterium 4572_88]|nr:MAG: hypothetical protein B6245_22670 [Desulfobacteraceae bacterium 4572_88]